jgi:chemotaxis protein CheX
MHDSLAALAPYSTDQFLIDDNMKLVDETIAEVYGMMLGLETAVVPERNIVDESLHWRTAIVGLSGALRGSCEVRMDATAAQTVTSAMLGDVVLEAEDASICDAVGEICNMIAGGWKNRIPALASACALSPPTIISGRDYIVKLGTPSVKFTRTYKFAAQTMQITMQCEELRRF